MELITYHIISCYEIVNILEIWILRDLSALSADFFYEGSLEEN